MAWRDNLRRLKSGWLKDGSLSWGRNPVISSKSSQMLKGKSKSLKSTLRIFQGHSKRNKFSSAIRPQRELVNSKIKLLFFHRNLNTLHKTSDSEVKRLKECDRKLKDSTTHSDSRSRNQNITRLKLQNSNLRHNLSSASFNRTSQWSPEKTRTTKST